MLNKIRQIYYDLRHQPVIAWVTFVATAVSVFLIMVVVMMQHSRTVPFSPESCRDRLLIGANLHTESIINPSQDSSSGLSYFSARYLYSDLDGVEKVTFFTPYASDSEVYAPASGDCFKGFSRKTDATFFEVFDHPLVEGRYYTADEADGLLPVVVISESTARHALGGAPWTGREVIIDNSIYTVVGVVRDNSTLATIAHGDIFIPTGPDDRSEQWGDYMGSLAAGLLVAPGVDFDHIRNQVKGRYTSFNAILAPENLRTIYHEAPYDVATFSQGVYSNQTPDMTHGLRMRLLLYAILLIVPAINLSSMLHSRLRRRVNEIGVRRAFGCTRVRIISDIIIENFLVTLAGGFIGIVMGIIFAASYSGLYETADNVGRGDTPALAAFLNIGTIVISLLICLILNILSASVPAWLASRRNPVEALNSK